LCVGHGNYVPIGIEPRRLTLNSDEFYRGQIVVDFRRLYARAHERP